MIGNAAHLHEVGALIATDCSDITVHSGPHPRVEPWLAIFCAKNDVEDDLAERLRHSVNDDRTCAASESLFQR